MEVTQRVSGVVDVAQNRTVNSYEGKCVQGRRKADASCLSKVPCPG